MARTWHNLSPAELYEHAIRRGEAHVVATGALDAETGQHTGRSPKDKFIVREPSSESRIWWGGNGEIDEASFQGLRDKVVAFLDDQPTLYVVNAFPGADHQHRIAVRVVTNRPYHALFAKTLFI